MSLVIADAGPLRYLIVVGAVNVLPKLYGRVVIPQMVVTELLNPKAPGEVSAWITEPPEWVEIREVETAAKFADLDAGENEAIQAALELGTPLLVDDLDARRTAIELGIRVIGTVGTLANAGKCWQMLAKRG